MRVDMIQIYVVHISVKKERNYTFITKLLEYTLKGNVWRLC